MTWPVGRWVGFELSIMTKLLEWLTAGILFVSLWLSILTGKLYPILAKDNFYIVLATPVILVGLFGIFLGIFLVYRVATFNDCEAAAKELRLEIEEAKKDLKSKGLVVG